MKQRYRHEPITLATVLAALDRAGKLSAMRKRDLRSAVTRVADLLGDEPAGIVRPPCDQLPPQHYQPARFGFHG